MTDSANQVLREALDSHPGMPVVFEDDQGDRHILNSDVTPYIHEDVLIIPIMEDES